MADAADLKSAGDSSPCRFESGPRQGEVSNGLSLQQVQGFLPRELWRVLQGQPGLWVSRQTQLKRLGQRFLLPSFLPPSSVSTCLCPLADRP
jgi:hypothetical protein